MDSLYALHSEHICTYMDSLYAFASGVYQIVTYQFGFYVAVQFYVGVGICDFFSSYEL